MKGRRPSARKPEAGVGRPDFDGLRTLLDAGRFGAARAHLVALARRLGETPDVRKWQGLLCEKTGDFAGARAALSRAVDLAPGNRELRRELARLVANDGGPDEPSTGRSPSGPSDILRITSACNQRCRFCFVALAGRRASAAAVRRQLEEARARAVDGLVISGGEPTTDPRLPEIVATARRMGLGRLSLQTNAVRLADAGLLARLVDLGLRNYFVSFQCHVPAVYDRLTGTRGQYSAAVRGLVNLFATRECEVTVNVVVNAENLPLLPEQMGFLGRLAKGAPRRPGVFFSMINDVGLRRAPELAVRLEDAARYLDGAVAACRRARLVVQEFEGECAFPVCVLRRPQDHAPPVRRPRARVHRAERLSSAVAPGDRVKRPSCRRCSYDAGCLGVSAAYARRFGLAELVPIGGGKRGAKGRERNAERTAARGQGP